MATPKLLEPFPTIVPAQYAPRFTNEAGRLMPSAAQIDRFARPGPDDAMGTYIRTELPGPQRLFMRESEAQFYDRIIQEYKTRRDAPAIFPPQQALSKNKHAPRHFENMPPALVEPCYVCHRRLLFEQPNFERTGYNFGILQPALGLGIFYYDLALMPYHAFSNLRDLGECNVGKTLPGDPAPFVVPRERFSLTGLAAEGASIVGLLYLFPLPAAGY